MAVKKLNFLALLSNFFDSIRFEGKILKVSKRMGRNTKSYISGEAFVSNCDKIECAAH